MRFYNRIEAVCRMNRLGAERRPFLFVIDYKQEQVIVEEPDQIDSEALLYNLDGVTNVATASRMMIGRTELLRSDGKHSLSHNRPTPTRFIRWSDISGPETPTWSI